MKKFLISTLLIGTSSVGFCSDDHNLEKVSESMGHLIGKNLDSLDLKIDLDKVIQGIKDAKQGKQPPLTEEQCVEAIAAVQEKVFHEEANNNKEKAVAFLKENASSENIIEIEPGKLQYIVEQTGEGPAISETDSPLVRYTGKYIDGTVFGSSEEGEKISLEDTIPGFKKGILGMKQGEKRTIFIHPDLGYGTNGFLRPNSLLQFEVEVLSPNTLNSIAQDSMTDELAKPSLEKQNLQ